MKNTVLTFLQFMENNKTDGNKKIAGFVIENNICVLQFYVFPTINEWLSIGEVWMVDFEQSISTLNMNKL